MRYPEFLKPGGTIGFIAPSFGCNIEPYHSAFLNACRHFKQSGYHTRTGRNCFASDGIGISSKPENCGRELTEEYLSEQNDVLISCGGGELMCEILDYVDFDLLKTAVPKWYMGYSDNTNFTFLSATILDTAAIYGPCAPAFGMEPWHPAIDDAFLVLTGKKQKLTSYSAWEKESLKSPEMPLAAYQTTEPADLHCFAPQNGLSVSTEPSKLTRVRELSMTGRLLGGCMDCLINLLGTSFDHVTEFNEKYKEDGIIWFLESCDLNVFGIRRAIWQMQHAGWFSYVRGFLIGRPYSYGQEIMGLDQYHAVIDLLGSYQVPVIMDADLGHLPPMMPIICGSMAVIEVHNNKLELEMQLI